MPPKRRGCGRLRKMDIWPTVVLFLWLTGSYLIGLVGECGGDETSGDETSGDGHIDTNERVHDANVKYAISWPTDYHFSHLYFHQNGLGKFQTQKEFCSVMLGSVKRDLERMFISKEPHIADVQVPPLPRFRSYDEDCDPDKEAEFYEYLFSRTQVSAKDLPEFKTANPKIAGRDLSRRFRMELFNKAWIRFLKDPIGRLICNPRYLLACKEDKKCGCRDIFNAWRTEGGTYTRVQVELERNIYVKTTYKDSGKSSDETLGGYRCVPKTGQTCDFFMSPIGRCSADCQYDAECLGTEMNGTKHCVTNKIKKDKTKAGAQMTCGGTWTLAGILFGVVLLYLGH